jgi:CRP-like cAMP-binding protein
MADRKTGGLVTVPEDELQRFKPYVRYYAKGNVIMKEGQTTDMCLYLLRQGTVEVTKQVGTQQSVLDRIEAVDVFGEMAVIAQRPRSATITVVSDRVVVYAFDSTSLSVILANTDWRTVILKRLISAMHQRFEQQDQTQMQLERLMDEQARLQGRLVQLETERDDLRLLIEQHRVALREVLGMFQSLYKVAKLIEDLRPRFFEAIPRLIAAYQRDLKAEPIPPGRSDLDYFYRTGVISEQLFMATNVHSGSGKTQP